MTVYLRGSRNLQCTCVFVWVNSTQAPPSLHQGRSMLRFWSLACPGTKLLIYQKTMEARIIFKKTRKLIMAHESLNNRKLGPTLLGRSWVPSPQWLGVSRKAASKGALLNNSQALALSFSFCGASSSNAKPTCHCIPSFLWLTWRGASLLVRVQTLEDACTFRNWSSTSQKQS